MARANELHARVRRAGARRRRRSRAWDEVFEARVRAARGPRTRTPTTVVDTARSPPVSRSARCPTPRSRYQTAQARAGRRCSTACRCSSASTPWASASPTRGCSSRRAGGSAPTRRAPRTSATSSTSTPSRRARRGLVGVWVDRPGRRAGVPASDGRDRGRGRAVVTSLDELPAALRPLSRRTAPDPARTARELPFSRGAAVRRASAPASVRAAPGSTPCGTGRRSTRGRAGPGGWRRARRPRRAARRAASAGSRIRWLRLAARVRRSAARSRWVQGNVACSGSVNRSPSSGSR